MAGEENKTVRRPRRPGKDDSTPARSRFTFVISDGKNGDILAKRIRDPDHRRVIRSQVMRMVRGREAEEGHKRKNGRGASQSGGRKTSKCESKPSGDDIHEQDQPSSASTSTSTAHFSPESDSSSQSSFGYSPGIQWIDPFETLYSKNGTSASVKFLLNYTCHVFIPMTYPVEASNPTGLKLLCGYLIQRASLSATFLSYLAIASAHRAITEKRHKDLAPSNESQRHAIRDPDYYILLDEAYAVMSQKTSQGEFEDGDVFEAHFALAAATATAGNFVEARKQIQLSREYLIRTGIDPDGVGRLQPMMTSADNKVSLGLLQAPLYRLPWEPMPIDERILARITPVAESRLSRLGSRFRSVAELSTPLLVLLQDLRNLCYFVDSNLISKTTLASAEHQTFHTKVQELEHLLLKYPLHLSPGPVNLDDIVLDRTTAVTRIAALSLLCRIGVVAGPSTGLGRSVTCHMSTAMRRWLDSDACHFASSALLEMMVWVLFLSIEGAEDQTEAPFFEDVMAAISIRRGWTEWEEVADAMLAFFYIPPLQEKQWRRIWDVVCDKIGAAQSHYERRYNGYGGMI